MLTTTPRNNRIFWELIIAFAVIVSAAVLQTFHFFNNKWLLQCDEKFEYQRGLGDDCVRSEIFKEGIRCSDWEAHESTFVMNGNNINSDDVNIPSSGLKMVRLFLIFSSLLYIAIIFCILIVCVRKDLRTKKLLCILSLTLVALNLISILILFVSSFFPFIKNKGNVTLGSAFYFFFLSNVFLWLGCLAHFDTWRDVYYFLINFYHPSGFVSELFHGAQVMQERRPPTSTA